MELTFNLENENDMVRLKELYISQSLKIKKLYEKLEELDKEKKNNKDFQLLEKLGKKLFIGDSAEYKHTLTEKQIIKWQSEYTNAFNKYIEFKDKIDKESEITYNKAFGDTLTLINNIDNLLVVINRYKSDMLNPKIKKFLKKLCEVGLPAYHTWKITDYTEIAKASLPIQEVFDFYINFFYANDFLFVRTLVVPYVELKDLTIENKYFNEALANLYNKNYYSCACSMFPLIENVYRQTQFYTSKERVQEFTDAITNYFKKNKLSYYKTAWTNLNLLIDKVYKKFKRTDREINILINRHEIEHGYFKRPIEFKDCLLLILLYINLIDIISIMSINHAKEELEKLKEYNDNLIKQIKEKENMQNERKED